MKPLHWLMVFIGLLAGCKKHHSTPSTATTGPHVYVTGYGMGAVYWKDGTVTTLQGGLTATGIAVSGNSVYVCGNAEIPAQVQGYVSEAVYWRNDTLVVLSGAPSYADAIAVSGSDVYIVGQAAVGGTQVAAIWKNGVLVPLSTASGSWAHGIAVSGSDIYVAGLDSLNLAVYWKNGAETRLDSATNSTSPGAVALGIAVSGSDVYAAGYVSVDNVEAEPVYWKNGSRVVLGQASSSAFYASSIAVSDTSVYVAGWQLPGYAVLWQNGNMIMLNNPYPGTNETNNMNSVCLYGGSVYVSLESDDYWKDGQIVQLVGGCCTTSILVQ
jgi:hypothetical protein